MTFNPKSPAVRAKRADPFTAHGRGKLLGGGTISITNKRLYNEASRKALWLCSDSDRSFDNVTAWLKDIDDTITMNDVSLKVVRLIKRYRDALKSNELIFSDALNGYSASIVATSIYDLLNAIVQRNQSTANMLADLWFREVTPGFLMLDLRGPEIVKLTPYTPADCSFV